MEHTPDCRPDTACRQVRTVVTAAVRGVSDVAQVADLADLRHRIDRATVAERHAGAVLAEPKRRTALDRTPGRPDRYTVTLTSAVVHR